MNLSRRLHWVRDSFLAGRVLATTRIRHWSRLRRLVYFAGSPFIPLLMVSRLPRLWPRRSQEMQPPWTTVPAFVAVSIAMALGEMSGYAVPAGSAELRRMIDNELHRELLLSRADEQLGAAP